MTPRRTGREREALQKVDQRLEVQPIDPFAVDRYDFISGRQTGTKRG